LWELSLARSEVRRDAGGREPLPNELLRRHLRQIVQFYIEKLVKGDLPNGKTENLGQHQVFPARTITDCMELKRLMADLGIEVNEVIPEGASVQKNLKNLPRAWFILVFY